jgi:hypothetical protein
MEKISLSNMDAFKVTGREAGEIFYGCNQDWYDTFWQRRSGCGPSVVAGIMMYRAWDGRARDKTEAVAWMEDAWKFVTPTKMGIPTVGMLLERVLTYGASKGMTVSHESLDVPEDRSLRPGDGKLAEYLASALSRDVPVAFLNLCNGEEHCLDEWHWVTVVGIERRDPDGHVMASLIDRGRFVTADMSVWLETTARGGGFLHFAMA